MELKFRPNSYDKYKTIKYCRKQVVRYDRKNKKQ